MAFYKDIKYRVTDAPSTNVENLDTITFDGSSTYSITKDSSAFSPNSSDNVLLSIDGVVQSGNFTITGSTIDFGTAIPSTSTCDFILHLGVGAIYTPADNTVTDAKIVDGTISLDKLSATGTKDSTTYLRGDNTFATVAAGGDNTPMFYAKNTASQIIGANNWNKLTFNTETYDTDSAFSSNRFTVPTGKGGLYCFNWHTRLGYITNGSTFMTALRLNGTESGFTTMRVNAGAGDEQAHTGTATLPLSAGDYIELYMYITGSASTTGGNVVYLSGFRIIE